MASFSDLTRKLENRCLRRVIQPKAESRQPSDDGAYAREFPCGLRLEEDTESAGQPDAELAGNSPGKGVVEQSEAVALGSGDRQDLSFTPAKVGWKGQDDSWWRWMDLEPAERRQMRQGNALCRSGSKLFSDSDRDDDRTVESRKQVQTAGLVEVLQR